VDWRLGWRNWRQTTSRIWGGTISSQCRDLGGFRAATDLLPHIRGLGYNAIWMMPLEDKSIYWPRDYYEFQEGLGTSDPSATILLASSQRLPQGGTRNSAWRLPPGAACTVEDGRRCVMVEGDGESYRLIGQTLPVHALKPGTRLRLSARMKGIGIERADTSWKTACLRWAVSAGGRTTYSSASLPWGNSDWRTWDVLLIIPENVESVTVEAGLNGNRGRVWIDDIQIEKEQG
jgi:hypothetical protein